MRRPLTRQAFWAAICCAALLSLASTSLTAAPAPFSHPAKKAHQLRLSNLVGTWTLYWHGAAGSVVLSSDGGYRCTWCGVEFVGTWKLSEDCIVITESCRPSASKSWHSFSVKLCPASSLDRDRPPVVRLERPR